MAKATRPPHAGLLIAAATIQGSYYVLTGLWSLVSIDTFQMVTGPKADLWLVRTVGLLVMVSGGVLLLAARRRHFSAEVVLLAIGQALALTAIDIFYVAVGRISPVYLLDALAEIILVSMWVAGLRGSSRRGAGQG
jgi:hypothetical protein